MKILDLEERLYTSTEVAQILGVSLRSVYRYLEDGKLTAEMKTATGRHRFTKQNILDFLSPQPKREPKEKVIKEEKEVIEVKVVDAPEEKEIKAVKEEKEEVAKEDEKTEEASEEVDWLAKFRAAAEKYKAETGKSLDTSAEKEEVAKEDEKTEEVTGLAEAAPAPKEEVEEVEEPKAGAVIKYYKSGLGGLKVIAQNIDRSAKKASLDYAFTMDAGLSLHKPIKPFSLIHSYVRTEDVAFFEKMLELEEVSLTDAQLCLIGSDEEAIYSDKKELHGLNIVSNTQLKKDLTEAGKEDLAKEID